MAFDYNARLLNVITALQDYNTTTSSPDLSSGLNVRIDNANILAIDPELTTPRSDRMPAIYVTIENKDEEYQGIGNVGSAGAMKNATVNFNIVGIVGQYGAWEGQSTTLSDVYKMSKNIESVFREEFLLSNTALYCNPLSTVFSPAIAIGDGFSKAVLVRLQAKYLFR